MRRLAAFAALWLMQALYACQPAYAETCPTNTTGTCACAVTAAGTTCLNAKSTSPYRKVVIDNIAGGATIGCTDNGLTPVFGQPGTYTIAPGTGRSWGGVLWVGPFICVSNGATVNATVKGQ